MLNDGIEKKHSQKMIKKRTKQTRANSKKIIFQRKENNNQKNTDKIL